MKVYVYWNLTKNVWSIKALQGEKRGRVIAHAKNITLKDCEFRVSEKGRQWVISNKRKTVHAGVVGQLVSTENCLEMDGGKAIPVTYNPYKYKSFVNRENVEEAVMTAKQVIMNETRAVTAYK